MNSDSQDTGTKILRRAKSPEEYKLYKSALEWNVAEPIVISSRDDLKSEKFWKDRIEPYHHQVTNLITFCRRLPVTLLADDVGLGKTISAGLIASELISRSRLKKILVVCPKLLGPQWQEELKTKFGLDSVVVTGRDLINADPEEPAAVITTYHSARMYLNHIPVQRFQMLILDEAHKLRNLFGANQPPQVAICFRNALEERRFRFVLMLTATPIHNRLWDIYSLIELLTIARGHDNPFGSEGMFARKFIADNRETARRLKPEAREEFRSIVYSYMSRVRRQDARLYFPDREVLLRKTNPTPAELNLIGILKNHINDLNILAQISILQALTSSPHALSAQLDNMARNGTVPRELAIEVRTVVSGMKTSAKLICLGTLIDELRAKDHRRWRLVVFTGRIETQTTIQNFLEEHGLKVGIINGSTAGKNKDTLEKFWKETPEYNVIVSTEAGSEGVNLQVANILVNFDLPWNPMIVEQRIGRIQRLASEHAKVSIFNIILQDTFEEYIVGRLMEKLQLAAHAIGDIESLLEASGVGGDASGAKSFEEQIRELVVTALTDKDYELATQQAERSIEEAKAELEREEATVNQLLGGMEGADHAGPQAPDLPSADPPVDFVAFTKSALRHFGAEIQQQGNDLYTCRMDGASRLVHIGQSNNPDKRAKSYFPESPAFLSLVDRLVATGIHEIEDLDSDPMSTTEPIARDWLKEFGGQLEAVNLVSVLICFEGSAVALSRITVAHDSYERLINIPCSAATHCRNIGRDISPLPTLIEDASLVGVDLSAVHTAVLQDEGVSEFRRFYLERRETEMNAVSSDASKRKKLEDDFTPRLNSSLVALNGEACRDLQIRVAYTLGAPKQYESEIVVRPKDRALINAPENETCAISSKKVPVDCLAECEISGRKAMEHLLVSSESSGRRAMPEFAIVCAMTNKKILTDEAERSAMTGQLVQSSLLRTSEVSHRSAEPAHFSRCEFTNALALHEELMISNVSGKAFRNDQAQTSVVSGRSGHVSEFWTCHETRQPILPDEAEQCEVAGTWVRPGILERCAATGSKALPSEMGTCIASGKRVLKSHLVESSLSGSRILDQLAVVSEADKFCTPKEAIQCSWTGIQCHPDDIEKCQLTAVMVHASLLTRRQPFKLKPLLAILSGRQAAFDLADEWYKFEKVASKLNGGKKCEVERVLLSPDNWCAAVCCRTNSFFGLRTRYLGFLIEVESLRIIGRHTVGKRDGGQWRESS